MAANKKLLILPGDGIGPEVMREVRRVIDWMDRRRMVTFDVSEDYVGGASIDALTLTDPKPIATFPALAAPSSAPEKAPARQ